MHVIWHDDKQRGFNMGKMHINIDPTLCSITSQIRHTHFATNDFTKIMDMTCRANRHEKHTYGIITPNSTGRWDTIDFIILGVSHSVIIWNDKIANYGTKRKKNINYFNRIIIKKLYYLSVGVETHNMRLVGRRCRTESSFAGDDEETHIMRLYGYAMPYHRESSARKLSVGVETHNMRLISRQDGRRHTWQGTWRRRILCVSTGEAMHTTPKNKNPPGA